MPLPATADLPAAGRRCVSGAVIARPSVRGGDGRGRLAMELDVPTPGRCGERMTLHTPAEPIELGQRLPGGRRLDRPVGLAAAGRSRSARRRSREAFRTAPRSAPAARSPRARRSPGLRAGTRRSRRRRCRSTTIDQPTAREAIADDEGVQVVQEQHVADRPGQPGRRRPAADTERRRRRPPSIPFAPRFDRGQGSPARCPGSQSSRSRHRHSCCRPTATPRRAARRPGRQRAEPSNASSRALRRPARPVARATCRIGCPIGRRTKHAHEPSVVRGEAPAQSASARAANASGESAARNVIGVRAAWPPARGGRRRRSS